MTPNELAGKITKECGLVNSWVPKISSYIRQAEFEAYEDAAKICDARAEMRDKYECDCRGYTRASEHNADEIRDRAQEIDGPKKTSPGGHEMSAFDPFKDRAYTEIHTVDNCTCKFTDDDLKRLKERNTDSLGRPVAIKQSQWQALIARLEASQDLNRYARHAADCCIHPCDCGVVAAGLAYRAAAGKKEDEVKRN